MQQKSEVWQSVVRGVGVLQVENVLQGCHMIQNLKEQENNANIIKMCYYPQGARDQMEKRQSFYHLTEHCQVY